MTRALAIIGVIAGCAGAFVLPQGTASTTARRSSTEAPSAAPSEESSKWMTEYLVKVHEARLEAVARARAEARAEAEARIADLEAQLALLQGGSAAPKVDAVPETVAAPEPAPVAEAAPAPEIVAEAAPAPPEIVAAPEAAPAPAPAADVNPAYAKRVANANLRSRWGSEELSRIAETPAPVVAESSVDPAYAARVVKKAKLSSRSCGSVDGRTSARVFFTPPAGWGAEELARLEA
mmetsp:Transcript_7980/g.20688  ORF Transcript_7980/g.20688 Transcript_7980/m.20688 type:complete len:236 (+) Transcript_7980:96-803(+)